jgi:predicted CxxxxCH...CXXCH cytochrome family protein
MSAHQPETLAVPPAHRGDVPPTNLEGLRRGHVPRMRSAQLGLITIVATALVACGDVRRVAEGRLAGPCTTCHGGLADLTGAPPFDVESATDSDAVGAHRAHVVAGVACQSCHRVPQNVEDTEHIDGERAEVTFGGLAIVGTTPEYSPQTLTCSNVYCHGATLGAGGSDPAPSWTETLPACGSCHDAPPPSHGVFVNPTNCSNCHPASVEMDDVTFKAAHLNGSLDVID